MNDVGVAVCVVFGGFLSWVVGSLINEFRLRLDPAEKSSLGDFLVSIAIILWIMGLPFWILADFVVFPLVNARNEKKLIEDYERKLQIEKTKVNIAHLDGIAEGVREAKKNYAEEISKEYNLGYDSGYRDGHTAGFTKGKGSSSVDQYAAHLSRMRKRALGFMGMFSDTPAFSSISNYDFIENPRLFSAIDGDISYTAPVELCASIRGSSGNVYRTTLSDCTCPDFQFRHTPCKHMYYLACDMGLLSTMEYTEAKKTLSEMSKMRAANDSLTEINATLKKRIEELESIRERPAAPSAAPTPMKKPKNEDLPTLTRSAENKRLSQSLLSAYELSQDNRYDLALARWMNQKKNRPQLGAMFERYIGYQCESNGYYVEYNGIEKKKADQGRDLLVFDPSQPKLYVVQCKYWASDKEIHEDAIYKLYGTVVAAKNEYPDYIVSGVLVCTCSLSDEASTAASGFPGIQHFDRCHANIRDYPCVKCATGSSGERYYYLPFDKSYDAVIADCYVANTNLAKNLGYERPLR